MDKDVERITDQIACSTTDYLAKKVYDLSKQKGFHENETLGEVSIERLAMFIANLHGECSELWEAARKGTLHQKCDKPVELTNLEEELADIIIRALDTAHSFNISIGNAILKKTEYNKTRPYKHNKSC